MFGRESSVVLDPVFFLIAGFTPMIWWRIKKGVGCFFFGLGALAWLSGVAVKAVSAYFASNPLLRFMQAVLPSIVADVGFWIYVGALTGVFENALAYLVVWKTKARYKSWSDEVAFGLGFGGVEAVLLGAGVLAILIAAMLMPQVLPKEAVEPFQMPTWYAITASFLAGIVERLSAISLHVFSNILVIRTVKMGQKRYFLGAFAVKTWVDASAVAFQQRIDLTIITNMALVEAYFLAIGILCFLLTLKLGRKSSLRST